MPRGGWLFVQLADNMGAIENLPMGKIRSGSPSHLMIDRRLVSSSKTLPLRTGQTQTEDAVRRMTLKRKMQLESQAEAVE